jgi:hypothetical protein
MAVGSTSLRARVFNALGAQALETEMIGGQTSLDLSGLPAGLYVVRVEDRQGPVSSVRVIKR